MRLGHRDCDKIATVAHGIIIVYTHFQYDLRNLFFMIKALVHTQPSIILYCQAFLLKDITFCVKCMRACFISALSVIITDPPLTV